MREDKGRREDAGRRVESWRRRQGFFILFLCSFYVYLNLSLSILSLFVVVVGLCCGSWTRDTGSREGAASSALLAASQRRPTRRPTLITLFFFSQLF